MKLLFKYRTAAALLIIYILGMAAYINSFRSDFVFDDVNSIKKVYTLQNITDIREIWETNHGRFIPFLTFAVNHRLGGDNPAGYHAVNITLHIVNSFLVYLFIKSILKTPLFTSSKSTKNEWLSLLAALLFAVHPIQTQAVNYISQRSALFSAFFYFLTLIFYLRKNIYFYMMSLLTLTAALVSKENSYTLPLAVVFCELYFFKKNKNTVRNRILKIIPYFFITFAVFSFLYLQGTLKPINRISSLNMLHDSKITRAEYLMTQSRVIKTYLGLLLFPVSQNADYDFPVSRNWLDKEVVASSALILLLLSAALYLRKNKPLLSFGIVFFFITLLIESSVIPIKDVIFEHRLYLPSAGFFICAAVVLTALKNKKTFLTLITPLLLILIILTVNRNQIWQSEYSLWKDTAAKSPYKARAHYNLGVAAYGQRHYEQAKSEFKRALELDGEYTDSYRNLSAVYEGEKNYPMAIEVLRNGITLSGDKQVLRSSLAVYFVRRKNFDEAEALYLDILKDDPRSAAAYNDLGLIYFIQNKKDQSVSSYLKALEINPEYENALVNLANTHYHFGEKQNAAKYYRMVLEVNPDNIPARQNLSAIDKN